MKKIILYTLLFFALITVISCKQDELPTPASQEQDLSEISSLEKQLGLTLFKQDLIISDASGKNTITMRFASLNQALLSEYLRTSHYAIEPILKNQIREHTSSLNPPPSSVLTEDSDDLNYDSKIITEVVETSLARGVVGYTTLIKNGKSNILSGRTKGERVWVEHTSGTWPEWVIVANGSASEYIFWELYKKNRNISIGWGHSYFSYLQYEAQTTNDIDGPYRVKIKLEYDVSYSYGVAWIQ